MRDLRVFVEHRSSILRWVTKNPLAEHVNGPAVVVAADANLPCSEHLLGFAGRIGNSSPDDEGPQLAFFLLRGLRSLPRFTQFFHRASQANNSQIRRASTNGNSQ